MSRYPSTGLFQLSAQGSLQKECEHADRDMSPYLEICVVIDGSQLQAALDDLEVFLDQISGAVEAAELLSGVRQFGVGDE